jgi:hypothetical protein
VVNFLLVKAQFYFGKSRILEDFLHEVIACKINQKIATRKNSLAF